MSDPKVIAAVVSAIVALITALISGAFAWSQLKRDKLKWDQGFEREQEKWKRELEHEQDKWRREIEREQDKWKQEIDRERARWLADMKANYNLELHKARLAAYPQILETIRPLSTSAPEPLTAESAKQIVYKINSWLYSSGGLCASKQTRGALLGLRWVCSSWGDHEDWKQLYAFRNSAILLLRRDIDVKGLESYDFDNLPSVLDELKSEISAIK